MKSTVSVHLANFLKDLPKCEHHLHIEGTLDPLLLFELSKRNGVQLPKSFPTNAKECYERYNNFTDLQDFLDHYYVGMSVLIEESDYYDLAMDYFSKAHLDGCLHSEIFFDPQAHTSRGVEIEKVIKGLRRACVDANTKYGTTNKLIACLLRDFPVHDCMATIHTTKPFFDIGWIHGLGLDSAEVPYPPHLFSECYKAISIDYPHVGLTSHAGEEADHSYVTEAIDHLRVTRIDHGIQASKNPVLLRRLAELKTLLTVCPVSNLKLQVVKDVAELPIRLFLENNIHFSINSDDPAYFGAHILDNYLAVQSRFELSMEEWCIIAKNSIHGSWCEETRKRELYELVDLIYAKYNKG